VPLSPVGRPAPLRIPSQQPVDLAARFPVEPRARDSFFERGGKDLGPLARLALERGIEAVCHQTHASNLPRILADGAIKPRSAVGSEVELSYGGGPSNRVFFQLMNRHSMEADSYRPDDRGERVTLFLSPTVLDAQPLHVSSSWKFGLCLGPGSARSDAPEQVAGILDAITYRDRAPGEGEGAPKIGVLRNEVVFSDAVPLDPYLLGLASEAGKLPRRPPAR
jgi:hypothetical protein